MKTTILGAIAGDTIGSIYEFNPTKDYNFPLFDEKMLFTDDSVLTIAIADWILHAKALDTDSLSERLRYWGNRYPYPMGGYGGTFTFWLADEAMGPYNSWGNGSAMRVSPVGYAFSTLEETLHYAEISAAVTHNHPDGIHGAQATAAAIFMARNHYSKEEIRKKVHKLSGYDLSRTCDDIRPGYFFESSCLETVPQALAAFFDSKDFEDAIRLTVSLGGDADTMGAITGGVAAAYYAMPRHIYDFVMRKLPLELKDIVLEFDKRFRKMR